MTSLELMQIREELRKERDKALIIAREGIIKAQKEYERIIQYYNQLNI